MNLIRIAVSEDAKFCLYRLLEKRGFLVLTPLKGGWSV
jgi:hypothetical protein